MIRTARSNCDSAENTYCIRASARVLELDVGFLVDAVEVLVQRVQDEGEHLLRVVLLIAGELRREPRYLVLPNAQRNNGQSTKQAGNQNSPDTWR